MKVRSSGYSSGMVICLMNEAFVFLGEICFAALNRERNLFRMNGAAAPEPQKRIGGGCHGLGDHNI